jgi:dihydroorotate dehydrogenase (fumarate)
LYSHNESYAEALEYLPHDVDFENLQADDYLKEIEEIKRSTSIPVIASLNGVSSGGWVKYASRLEQAGADALELHLSFIPTDIKMDGATVEQIYVDTVALVKEHISIPLTVKMNRYFSNPANMANRFVQAGADGLVLFDNPVSVDIDLTELSSVQRAQITTSTQLSESLRWCGILYRKLACSLCAGTGIHSGADVLKAVMSGADAVALASVLLMKGEKEVGEILHFIQHWMEENEYDSINQMKGSISLEHTDNPSAYERSSYMHALQNFDRDLDFKRRFL